jgi:hypothetical protein
MAWIGWSSVSEITTMWAHYDAVYSGLRKLSYMNHDGNFFSNALRKQTQFTLLIK